MVSMSLARSRVWNYQHRLSFFGLSCSRLLRLFQSREPMPIELAQFQVNSRFLAFPSTSTVYKLSPSIFRFWNLQTLVCHGMSEVEAPTDMWYMPHIRHVRFDQLSLPDPPNDQDGIVLENLQTLGLIVNFKCSEQVIKRIPNIKKLKIMYDWKLGGDDHVDMFCVSNFHCLGKLESLSCSFDFPLHLITFPHSLKKLTLVVENYGCWDEILEKIGVLPLLQKLKLEGGKFRKVQWVTSEGQFRSLKFLGLTNCENLRVWTTESSHFPCLEHLSLYGMFELKEIPLEFADISTLRVIQLKYCSNSAAESAKRILEEQEESNGEATIRVEYSSRSTRKFGSVAF